MPRQKKKFVDKKAPGTSVFQVVHRSQRDPLAADADAPQHVLKPLDGDMSNDAFDLQRSKDVLAARKEEERSYGVFFDDDYDYMQHLRDRVADDHDYELVETTATPKTDTKKSLQLPSSVFESSLEASSSLAALESRGPRLDWDPDIIETLDDAFDGYETVVKIDHMDLNDNESKVGNGLDELDHDLALALEGNENDEYEHNDEYDNHLDDVDSMDGDGFGSEIDFHDSKMASSRFTEYSMSSAVTRRSENLKKLDDQFEEFMEQYEEEHVGALVLDEATDFGLSKVEDSIMRQLVIDDQEKKSEEQEEQKRVLDITLEAAQHEEDEEKDESEDKEESELLELKGAKENWDCESILSTYSNLYHHPKLISEPKSVKKRVDKIEVGPDGMPLRTGLTARNLRRLDATDSSELILPKVATSSLMSTETSKRSKSETSDERRDRKALIKLQRKERRLEKKCNQLAFKEEQQRQQGARSSVQIKSKPIL